MISKANLGRQTGGWKPALSLLVIAPMAGELITSSAPPYVFFIPWVFVLFALLYGCGALLIRELAVRWNSGWIGILLLGAAYGILEEGLGAKSFFDPNWRALGPLGSHGRALGVNWVWTIGLTLFHSGFCIAISILAASLPFPKLRSVPWLRNRTLSLVALAYFLVLLLFFQKGNENGYQAPEAYYWLSIALSAALILAARFVRPQPPAEGNSPAPAWYFAATGFGAIVSFVLILYAVPTTGIPAWLTATLLVAFALVVAVRVTRWSHAGRWALSSLQEFGLVAGTFGAFAVMAPFQEWNPARGSSARGMTLVGLSALGYLYCLRGIILRNISPVHQEGDHVR